ncbi:hypothetical protein GF336_07510 [Candidatus Woesearchaeota archaeon]|nr:hypothetical protein [Candidatus Woesearchaeota archaeon]
MPRISIEEAKKILEEVDSNQYFWINNGPIVKSLFDLPEVLRFIDDNTFKYHVNDRKNDLAEWIEETVGDCTLAKVLKRIKTKGTTINKVNQRLAYLKKLAKVR